MIVRAAAALRCKSLQSGLHETLLDVPQRVTVQIRQHKEPTAVQAGHTFKEVGSCPESGCISTVQGYVQGSRAQAYLT